MKDKLSKKFIIKKIIEENGNCEWVSEYRGKYVCKYCPFNTLKKKDEYNFFSCYEAVNGSTRPEYEVSEQRYKDKAIKLLIDMVVEEELLGYADEEDE